jgi:hypothetical protein
VLTTGIGRLRPGVVSAYGLAALVSASAFTVGASVLAITLPYHDWDAFSFGIWSREIAVDGRLDPFSAGSQVSARPLFYLIQGAVWSVTGVSFSAGRLLSLSFALLLILGVWLLVRRVTGSTLEAALATSFVVAIASFGSESLEGKSDVPTAAGVAVTAWLAVRAVTPAALAGAGAAALAAMLMKPTAMIPLAGLSLCLAVTPAPRRLRDVDRRALAVAAGLCAALIYDVVMALRFHLGLVDYLGGGTIGGFYAQLAAQARWHSVLRADVLGSSLSFPLTYALTYSATRLCGVRHKTSALIAFPTALIWAFGGPYPAGVPHGPFTTSESAFTVVGFACISLAIPFVRDEDVPRRRAIALAALLGLPSLVLWVWGTAYANRLASGAWPGLVMLMAIVAAAGVRGLWRLGSSAAVAPIVIIAVAVWMSLSNLDGLHGSQWVEYRSLGWNGAWDRNRTMNIVLPSVQSALALATPRLGSGKLITGDPRFQYFLPQGRVVTTTPLHCREVNGFNVFILLTADESEAVARQEHGLATPQDWARCSTPVLRQLTDGSNGFAVFAVGKS